MVEPVRILASIAAACLVLGLATPAVADDPPIESGEAFPIFGGSCLTAQNAPAATANHIYLQSFFQVSCSVSSDYRVTKMHTDAKYAASPGGGVWNQYSNSLVSKEVSPNATSGVIVYNPLSNGCHWGGDWNYYRRLVALDVTVRRVSTGVTVTESHSYYRVSPNRIPCGDHE
jgi:hypothetical protein